MDLASATGMTVAQIRAYRAQDLSLEEREVEAEKARMEKIEAMGDRYKGSPVKKTIRVGPTQTIVFGDAQTLTGDAVADARITQRTVFSPSDADYYRLRPNKREMAMSMARKNTVVSLKK